MSDPAEIAAKLTKAQREAVLEARERLSLGSMGDAPLQVNAGGATAALVRKGIIREIQITSLTMRRSRIYALTPLGLAVRRHLLENGNG